MQTRSRRRTLSSTSIVGILAFSLLASTFTVSVAADHDEGQCTLDAGLWTCIFEEDDTFTVPGGVTEITVNATGGGGGGGAGGSNANNAKGGGGGGAYAESTLSVAAEEIYDVIVGLGGAPGAAGGPSSFGDGDGPLVRAVGGSSTTTGAGGLGGAAVASIGDTTFSGGAGGDGIDGGPLRPGGGGGGSGGLASDGADGGDGFIFCNGSCLGLGGAGGAGQGDGGDGGDHLGSGDDGSFPGGGGGGKGGSQAGGITSGSGADGLVVVTFTDPWTITGVKFHDRDADGEWDEDEEGLNGWTIELYFFDGEESVFEALNITFTHDGQDGTYIFQGQLLGLYLVCEVLQDGWQQTTPDDCHPIFVAPGDLVEDLHFGNVQSASIHGTKFEDVNGNGAWDEGEPGIPGWAIHITGGASQASFDPIAVDEAIPDDSETAVSDEFEVSGLSGTIVDLDVDFAGSHAHLQDLLITLEGPESTTVILQPGGESDPSGDGQHDILYDDESANSLEDCSNEGPVVDSCRPFEALSAFDGQDPNGFWTLTVFDSEDFDDDPDSFWDQWSLHFRLSDGAEPVTVFTMEDDPETEDDETGMYWVEDLLPGMYWVCEDNPAGWTQTDPDGCHLVELSSGQTAEGFDFRNFAHATINVTKYHDLNGNGVQDGDESGVPGWNVCVDAECHDTDDDGNATFAGLGPGTYTVTEESQDGWTNSTVMTVDVTPQSNETVFVEFGNFQNITVNGTKFHDHDGDGTRDPGDEGLEGWEICVYDTEGNEVECTQTDDDGEYNFTSLAPGAYSVNETLLDGWVQTYPADGAGHPLNLLSGDEEPELDFGNFELVRLNGTKFEDVNGNGERDPGEPGIEGWAIFLLDEVLNELGQAVTDENGDYEFVGVGPGSFFVAEDLPDGFEQTFPPGTFYEVEAASGEDVPELDFGNFAHAEIHGTKFEDVNGNGARDMGELGLQDWPICLDGDGLEDPVCTETDPDGQYSFTGLAPGTYTVNETLQPGWNQTFPAGDAGHEVTLSSGDISMDNDFGNFADFSINGTKFHDHDGDGERDGEDEGLSGWVICLTTGISQEYDDPICTFTDEDGNYAFEDLGPGTYTVNETLFGGWTQTYPGDGAGHEVAGLSGQALGGHDFGNFADATINVTKYEDVNGNGVRDEGEPGVPDWNVCVDSGCQDTDGDGNATFAGLGPGTYTVAEESQDGWTPSNATSVDVSVRSGEISFVEFGNFQNIALNGTKFLDVNGNGTRDAGEPGLPGWEICLHDGEGDSIACTVTDADGDYNFTDLAPGTYNVTETLKEGWTQTHPAEGFHLLLDLLSGESQEGLDFGNFKNFNITGTKWEDLFGDGVRQNHDPAIAGWTIRLFDNVTGEEIANTTTDAAGAYSFNDVGPGEYRVEEDLPAGWNQTFPGTVDEPGNYTFGGVSGTDADDLDFGNFELVSISGRVFSDPNGDGFLSDRQPLEGWPVELLVENSPPAPVGMTHTDANGRYAFSGLPPGLYHVRVGQRDGWVQMQPVPIPPGEWVVRAVSGTDHDFHDFVFRPELLQIEVTTDRTDYWIVDGNDVTSPLPSPFEDKVHVTVTATLLGSLPAVGTEVDVVVRYESGNPLVDGILAGTGCEVHSESGMTDAFGLFEFDMPHAVLSRCLDLGIIDLADLPTDLLGGRYVVDAVGVHTILGVPNGPGPFTEDLVLTDDDTTTYQVQVLPPPLTPLLP